jgi:hypothetical protein
MATALPLETQTLYAELLEHLLGVQAQRSIGGLGGSFTEKTIKGERYLYWQASEPGGRKRQFYLGRRTPGLQRALQSLERSQHELAPDLERVQRLSAQLRAGGANAADHPSARVVRALAQSGLFDAGAVLVGTHAFAVLGNLLGVRWVSGSPSRNLDVAVPDVQADVPSVLESLQMGFSPVPPLNPKHPSTSFKVRGQSLRVDLISPKRGSTDDPIFIRRFNAAAQPLAHLDYVMEKPEKALFIDGGATLVNVPTPARFAFHKLLVAPLRPPAFQVKAEKDVAQALQILEVLVEARPGDLPLAWEGLREAGSKSEKAAEKGLVLLRRKAPDLHQRVASLIAA